MRGDYPKASRGGGSKVVIKWLSKRISKNQCIAGLNGFYVLNFLKTEGLFMIMIRFFTFGAWGMVEYLETMKKLYNNTH